MSLGRSCAQHVRYTRGCDTCRERARKYRSVRKRGLRDGSWDRMYTGDRLQQVRAHVEVLMAVPGVSGVQIAQAGCMSTNTVYRLVRGETTSMRADIAQVLLALTVQLCLAQLPDSPSYHRVDATGTARRLRALAADGWDTASLSAICGVDPTDLARWRWLRREHVTQASRDLVAQLYEKIQGMPDPTGPSRSAATHARRLGYLPPERWDDQTIDDPAAQPLPEVSDQPDWVLVDRVIERALASGDSECTRGLDAAGRLRLAQHAQVRGWTRAQTALVLGMSVSGVEYMLRGRADRPHTRTGKGKTHAGA